MAASFLCPSILAMHPEHARSYPWDFKERVK